MQVSKIYSHKDGENYIKTNRPNEWQNVIDAIEQCNAPSCMTKISSEKTKQPLLFSPVDMNNSIKLYLSPLGWTEPSPGSKKGFKEPRVKLGNREFREMDGIKNKVGLEIQFGKYAFMGYDLFSKMPIFHKRGLIDCGIEVVVMHSMICDMSTGVSSYDQIVLDIENRGEADLDLPSVIVGMEPTLDERKECQEKRIKFAQDRDGMIQSGQVSKGFKGAKPGPKGSGSIFKG